MKARLLVLLATFSLGLVHSAANAQAQPLFVDSFETPRAVDQQVVILPGTRLLTQSGSSAQLAAEVRDANGSPVQVPVRWRSTRPDMISVDEQGIISAEQSLGSAQIIAEAAGALPAAVLVTVASPVAGAVLVPDAAVVAAPQAVDTEAPYGLGYQYTVSLTGIAAPQVGDIVLGSGQQPVGGRVLAVTDAGGQVDLTLEVVPLDEMFAQLSIHETFDIKRLAMEYPDDVQGTFDYQRYDDGTLELTVKPPAQKGGPQGTTAIIDQFMDCSESTLPNPGEIVSFSSGATLTFNPSLSVDLDYERQSGEFAVEVAGGVRALVELKPRITATIMGKVSCKFQVAAIPIPIGGPLALLFSGSVPVGAGVEVSGTLSLPASLGYDFNVVGSHQVEAGVECEPDCNVYGEVSVNYGASATPVLPGAVDTINDFQLDLNAFLFLFADLEFGNPFLRALSLKTLGAKAGVTQSASFRSIASQANDSAYASSFKLEATATLGPAGDLVDFLELLQLIPPAAQFFTVADLLATSPVGSFVITDPNGGSSATAGQPATVIAGSSTALGDQATFTVTLSPVNYIGQYIVEGVEIYWLRPDGTGGMTLQPNRPGCSSLGAGSGQRVFTCQTDFTSDHVGEQTFYAFVRASLFGVSLPFLLETANNSQAKLTVVSNEPPELTRIRVVSSEQVAGFAPYYRAAINNLGDVVSDKRRATCCEYDMFLNDQIHVSGGGEPFFGPSLPLINDAGTVIFGARLDDTQPEYGLFDGPNPGPVGTATGDTIAVNAAQPDLNNLGDVVWLDPTDHPTVRIRARFGDTTYLVTSFFDNLGTDIYCPQINDQQVVAWVERSGATYRIMTSDFNGTAMGEPQAVLEGATEVVNCVAMNNNGTFAFFGDPEGFSRNALFKLDLTGQLEMILNSQGNDPDSAFTDISGPVAINDDDVIAFVGEREDDEFEGVYLTSDLSTALVTASETRRFPDGNGNTYRINDVNLDAFRPQYFNNRGEVAFAGHAFHDQAGQDLYGVFVVSRPQD